MMALLHRLLLLSALLRSAFADCPQNCVCELDETGRRKITCSEGGMSGYLDLTKFSTEVEVLEITAPDDNYNALMIGPIFGAFKSIEEIHITKSNIPEIGEHSFWRILSLRTLDLKENNITTVIDSNFRGLANLTQLYLDDNRIERISSGTFKYLTELRVLSLSRNRLAELVTRVFESLSKLRSLDLSGNPLRALNAEIFQDITGLQVLECRGCSLKRISSDIFEKIIYLRKLDLGENHLREIDGALVDLVELETLLLDGNKLEAIGDGAFASHGNLTRLSLARNALTAIPEETFSGNANLEHLDIGYNKISQLKPGVFRSFMKSLRHLDLSGTGLPMSDLRFIVETVRKIRHLGLSNLDLHELPPTLFNFNQGLVVLNLSGNRFEHVPVAALAQAAKLEKLDMSRNRLRGLDYMDLQRLELIPDLQLQYNPWTCDLCHIEPIMNKMNETARLREIVCYAPKSLKGERVGALDKDRLTYCSTNEIGAAGDYFIQEGTVGLIAAIAGILLVVLTVLALLAAVCYTRRHAANYYTREETRNDQDKIFDKEYIFENGELEFKFPMYEKIEVATIMTDSEIPVKTVR